ncbi:hypothetical protein [Streptomyces sp. NBC_01617]
MKFQAITLTIHTPAPVTGVRRPTDERFREVIDNAVPVKELGLDRL